MRIEPPGRPGSRPSATSISGRPRARSSSGRSTISPGRTLRKQSCSQSWNTRSRCCLMAEPIAHRLPWKSQAARRLFESYLPGIHELNREMTRAAAVASAWLVTLTTGLLALLLSNGSLLGSADELGRRTLLGLAIVVVGTGVVYRILSMRLDRQVSMIQRQLTTILAADGAETLDPSEPALVEDIEDLAEAY